MTPFHFIGQDRVLEAPPGYDHQAHGEVCGLPVAYTEDGRILSVWKPSREELVTLLRGGGVVLELVAQGQPPVAISVTGPEQLLVPA